MARSNDLTHFVAIDFETTGTDPARDEIIELGAVWAVDGRIVASFDRLVAPEKPISKAITRMTGISEADCAGQPPLAKVLPDFIKFLGSNILVAHNAPFDISFLNSGMACLGLGSLNHEVHDTLLLSRILLPCLRNHQLATLLGYFEIHTDGSHRAETDADGAAQLFLALAEYARRLDHRTIQSLLAFCPPDSSLHRFFSSAWRAAPVTSLRRTRGADGQKLHFSGVDGEQRRKKKNAPELLDAGWIERFLSADGGLARVLPQFEDRPQQIKMAREVSRAFNNGECLLVEAGTGVGKTMAYLTPAVSWAVANGERVILSTKTKTLQEQLFYKDIPILQEALGKPFTSVLMKGRSNYLCLSKWYRTLSEGFHSQGERSDALPLIVWVDETDSGDVSENAGFWNHQRSGLWNRICSEGSDCAGPRCAFADRCFYQKVKAAAGTAHIVVVNHALLFSDAILDHSVLDRYAHLVVDEAHGLEKIATQHFGCTVSLQRVQMFLDRLHRGKKTETGLLPFLAGKIAKAPGKAVRKNLSDKTQRAVEGVERARLAARELFAAVAGLAGKSSESRQRAYTLKKRYGADDGLTGLAGVSAVRELEELAKSLSLLSGEMLELSQDSKGDLAEVSQTLKGLSLAGQELARDIGFLLSADQQGYVYWIERPERQEEQTALCAAPLNVGEQLASRFYGDLRTLILTSGTLTVGGRFDYVMERLGLDPQRTARCITGTPFDYGSQARLCVPAFLPSPKAPAFPCEVGRLIEETVLATRRSAMALFTSYDMLASVSDRVRRRLEPEGITVLAQSADGPRSRLIAQFADERPAVLMGTESFWEGVDIPGQALEILIITKLPFAVPSEPYIMATMERFEAQGRDAFGEYSVPEAVIKLRQGFGRLIRTRQDKGIVVLCDTRVVTTHYGRLFLDSLPTRPTIYSEQERFIEDMGLWL